MPEHKFKDRIQIYPCIMLQQASTQRWYNTMWAFALYILWTASSTLHHWLVLHIPLVPWDVKTTCRITDSTTHYKVLLQVYLTAPLLLTMQNKSMMQSVPDPSFLRRYKMITHSGKNALSSFLILSPHTLHDVNFQGESPRKIVQLWQVIITVKFELEFPHPAIFFFGFNTATLWEHVHNNEQLVCTKITRNANNFIPPLTPSLLRRGWHPN